MESACQFSAQGLAEEQMRMLEHAQQGFHCNEILMFAGLEAQGKTNPDLIRAVSALAGGLGFSGELCGALTGGACLLGLYDGRGDEREETSQRLNIMVNDLVDWFKMEYGQEYGGIRCSDITEDDPKNNPQRCPFIVSGVLNKVKSLVDEYGLDWKSEGSSCRPDTAKGPYQEPASGNQASSGCPCEQTGQGQ